MAETAAQYVARVMAYLGDRDPLAVQAATPRKLERLMKGVPRRQLARRPAAGKWSVVEIVSHLADGEIVGGYRVRRILGAPGCELPGFDQDKWAEAGKYSQRDPQAALELFRVLRRANLALFKSLSRDQWALEGTHAERGVESVATYARMFAGHDLNHLRQVEAILRPPR